MFDEQRNLIIINLKKKQQQQHFRKFIKDDISFDRHLMRKFVIEYTCLSKQIISTLNLIYLRRILLIIISLIRYFIFINLKISIQNKDRVTKRRFYIASQFCYHF